MLNLKHSDGFCDGEIGAIQETYGQGKPSIEFYCLKCKFLLGRVADIEVEGGEAVEESNDSPQS